jgi:hypothetical protein
MRDGFDKAGPYGSLLRLLACDAIVILAKKSRWQQ